MWAKITTCSTSRYSSSTDTDHSQMFSSKAHLSYNQKKTKQLIPIEFNAAYSARSTAWYYKNWLSYHILCTLMPRSVSAHRTSLFITRCVTSCWQWEVHSGGQVLHWTVMPPKTMKLSCCNFPLHCWHYTQSNSLQGESMHLSFMSWGDSKK